MQYICRSLGKLGIQYTDGLKLSMQYVEAWASMYTTRVFSFICNFLHAVRSMIERNSSLLAVNQTVLFPSTIFSYASDKPINESQVLNRHAFLLINTVELNNSKYHGSWDYYFCLLDSREL